MGPHGQVIPATLALRLRVPPSVFNMAAECPYETALGHCARPAAAIDRRSRPRWCVMSSCTVDRRPCRYVTSLVRNYQLENGYNIWSFQGKLLHTHREAKFLQFLWRPRPPSLLSKDKEKEIRKNLAEYAF